MSAMHEPDPRFLEHLEWQLTSDRRRRASFGEPTENLKKRRNIKMIGIVFCSVLTGVMATATTTHLQDVAQGRLYLAQAEVQLQLADSRLALYRKNLEYLKERVALGVVSKEEGSRAEGDVARLEIEKQRLELDYEETLASRRQPRNELSAPLVNGRDFVTERLMLDVKRFEIMRTERMSENKIIKRQVAAGLVQAEELQTSQQGIDDVRRFAMDDLNKKIELRAAFLREEISAENVDLMVLSSDAEQKIKKIETWIAQAKEDYAAMEKRHQLGLVSTPELDGRRFRLETLEANLKLARLEWEIIQTNLNK